MKQKETKSKLESILNKGKMLFLAGVASLAIGCVSIKDYVEPKLGLIGPVAAQEQAFNPSFLIGGAYGFNIDIGKTGLEMIGLEAGLDYFHSSGEYIETHSILPRINVSYYPLEPFLKSTVKVKPYLMAGINLLGEFSTIDIPEFDVHENVSNATFGLEFGIGATIFDRIHGRLSYTVLPASENVKGMITLTVGYRFVPGEKIWDAE